MNADGDLAPICRGELASALVRPRVALGFNMLNFHPNQKNLYYADPDYFLAFAARKWVVGYGWLTASRQRNL